METTTTPLNKDHPPNAGREIGGQKYFRQFKIRAEDINKEDRTVSLSFASEQPVQQWYGTEQLEISSASVDLSRVINGLCSLLVNHNPDNVAGIVMSAEVVGNRIKALVRFSKSAYGEEIFNDVIDMIRQGVSFGYTIDDYDEIRNDAGTTIIVKRFTVFEVSICSIPADATVGVNRSLASKTTQKEIENMKTDETKTPPEGERELEPTPPAASSKTTGISEAEREAIVVATRSGEMKRIGEIDAIANGAVPSAIPSVRELALKFKETGKTVEEFRAAVMDEINKRNQGITKTAGKSDFTGSDIKDFSISRALIADMSKDWSGAKREREMMDHAAHKAGRQLGGIYLPMEVISKRDLTTSSAAGAVAVQSRYDLQINPLYAQSITSSLGATILSGLSGVVTIPRLLTSFAVDTPEEGVAIAGGDGTFDKLTLTPKAIAANAVYSKQLLIQSESNVDQIILNDILKQIPLKLDRMAIAKLLSDAGIPDVTCAAALSFAHMLAMESDVRTANVGVANLAYATSPAVMAKLKGTLKGGSNASFIWENDQVNGYKALASSQLAATAGQVIFGDFSELYVAYFGNGLEIITDQFSKAATMEVVLTASLLADTGIRHPKAFARIKDAVIS